MREALIIYIYASYSQPKRCRNQIRTYSQNDALQSAVTVLAGLCLQLARSIHALMPKPVSF